MIMLLGVSDPYSSSMRTLPKKENQNVGRRWSIIITGLVLFETDGGEDEAYGGGESESASSNDFDEKNNIINMSITFK